MKYIKTTKPEPVHRTWRTNDKLRKSTIESRATKKRIEELNRKLTEASRQS